MNSMVLTDARIEIIDKGPLRAFVDITLNNCLVIKGIKLIRSHKDKLFLAMPSKKDKKNNHHDIAFPITKELREMLETEVLERYAIEVLRDEQK